MINFRRSHLTFLFTSLSILSCVTVLLPIHGIQAETNSIVFTKQSPKETPEQKLDDLIDLITRQAKEAQNHEIKMNRVLLELSNQIDQTKPINSKPNTTTETTPQNTSPPKQQTIKYTTYSFAVSGNGYGMSGQFTLQSSKKDNLDKSDVVDFQLNANYDGDQFLCKLDSLANFESNNRNLSFKCENRNGLAALDYLNRSVEIRIVYNSPNRFGQKATSFSGYPISIQKINESISSVTNNPANIQSFEKFCEQKNDLNPETKKTVDILLDIAYTKHCKAAMYRLQREFYFHLPSKGITDLQPIASFTNLRELFLSGNQISDVTPLSGLTKLEKLDLAFNQISDVDPLSNLTNLTDLTLTGNQIKNVQSLCKLPRQSGISLYQNPTSQLNCRF